MDILFLTEKLSKEFNAGKSLVKRHGSERAKRIVRRLAQLRAAAMLEELRGTPGRCHELTGNRAGELTLDLDGPYRLVFRPAQNPLPTRATGGLDWTRVTAVIILGVEDTHE